MLNRSVDVVSKRIGSITILIKSDQIRINTERLELRSFCLDSYDLLVENYSQVLGKEVNVALLNDGKPWTRQRINTMVSTEKSKQINGELFGIFSVYNARTQQFMGSLSMRHVLTEYEAVGVGHKNVVEMGFFLDEAFWGNGYGTEIAVIANKYAKHVLCKQETDVLIPVPKEIVATAHPLNEKSIKILAKTLKSREEQPIIKYAGQQRLLFFKPLLPTKLAGNQKKISTPCLTHS